MNKYAAWILLGWVIVFPVSGFAVNDPTRPESIVQVEGDNPWELTAIYISKQKRIAVMQDTIVTIGSKVDNAEVVDIQPEYVLLKGPNEVFKVLLLSTSIKQVRK